MDDLLGLSLAGSGAPSSSSSAPSAAPARPPPMGSGAGAGGFDALSRGHPASRTQPSSTSTPRRPSPAAAAGDAPRPPGQDAFASLFASAVPAGASKPDPRADASLPLAARQQSQMTAATTAAPQPAPAPASNDPFNFSGLDDDVFGINAVSTGASVPNGEEAAANNDDDDDILGLLGKPPDEVLRQRQAEAEAEAARNHARQARQPDAARLAHRTQPAPFDVPGGRSDDDDGWGGLGAPSRQRTSLDSVRSEDDHHDLGQAPVRATASGPEPAPHLVGQLVEMGFDVGVARSALIQSHGDVQVALDGLLSASGGPSTAPANASRPSGRRTMTDEFTAWQKQQSSRPIREGSSASRRPPENSGEQQDWVQIQHQLKDQATQLGTAAFARATSFWSSAKAQVAKALDEHPAPGGAEAGPAWARQTGQTPPTRTTRVPQAHAQDHLPSSSSPKPRVEHDSSPAGSSDWASRAAERAAEAARSWQRKLAAAQGVAPKAASIPDGRPKWMTAEAEHVASAPADDAQPKWMAASGPPAGNHVPTTRAFQEDQGKPASASAANASQLGTTASKLAFAPTPGLASDSAPSPSAGIGSVSARLRVEAEAEAGAYVSPARRRRMQGSTPTSGTSTPVAPPKASTSPKPLPVSQRSARSVMPDSEGAVTQWRVAKKAGNDAFGRGAYGDAETAYTQALNAVQDGSLRRVVILNNRAACRLHNGDAPGAMTDTQAVLKAIAGGAPEPPATLSIDALLSPNSWSPLREAPLPKDIGQDVGLAEAWGKALMRYAQAAEAAERYVSARKAWMALQKFERTHGAGSGAAMRSRSATEGLARCDAAMKPASRAGGTANAASTTSQVSAQEAASVRAAGERASAAARAKFREASQAKEGEDAQRLALKDGVDSKLATWKAGKENNIRALLGSVSTIVGDTPFAPPKVGMHQLVTDIQVKKAYMKTISRLHPDKLATTTNLEHRMLAAGAFAALNDAWVVHAS